MIKESLGNITRGRATAQTQKFFLVTFKGVKSCAANLVIPSLPSLENIVQYGQLPPGIGKIPLSTTIAMVLSEYLAANVNVQNLFLVFDQGITPTS